MAVVAGGSLFVGSSASVSDREKKTRENDRDIVNSKSNVLSSSVARQARALANDKSNGELWKGVWLRHKGLALPCLATSCLVRRCLFGESSAWPFWSLLLPPPLVRLIVDEHPLLDLSSTSTKR